jgi:hypothetical protein
MDLRDTAWNLLAYGALPLWLLAGAADWLCHRRTFIERTSGPRESLLHLLLYGEIAIPLVLALFFEINALLLTLMAVGVVAHMATSWVDTTVAQPCRYIGPTEQLIHSWLEMLPVFALAMVFMLNLGALSGPEWWLRPRAVPLPGALRTAILAALAVGVSFILEELIRGLVARRRQAARAGPSHRRDAP